MPYGNIGNVNRFRGGARHNSIDDGSRGSALQNKNDRPSVLNIEKTSVGAILNPKYSFGNQFKTFYESKDNGDVVREKDLV